MMNRIGWTAALLLLAACDKGAPERTVRDIEVPEGNYQERLVSMPEGERNAVFIRAIRDAGRDCQQVTSSALQGERGGQPLWTARCNDGGEWIILIGRGGIAQVANAAELKAAAANSSLP